MIDAPDSAKMTEAFGLRLGKMLFRVILVAVVIGAVTGALIELRKFVYGDEKSAKMPSSNCVVSGGTNYGNLRQDCDVH